MLMNIETVFTRSKMVRAKYLIFMTKSYLTRIFKSTATGTLCHKMKSPYITMCLLNWKISLKDTISCYLKMQNED